MQIPRFFVEQPLPARVGDTLALGSERARQARSVLRLRTGYIAVAFDGSGREAMTTVEQLTSKECILRVTALSHPQREPLRQVHVGVALLRGDQMSLTIQKLTELGVARITLLTTEHTVIALKTVQEREQRLLRLQRVAIEAAEQSERTTIPQLRGPVDVAEFLTSERPIVLLERSDAAHLSAYVGQSADAVTVAIGPEGGWSERERALIADLGLPVAHLGGLILRAETCAIVAASLALHASGDLQSPVEDTDASGASTPPLQTSTDSDTDGDSAQHGR